MSTRDTDLANQAPAERVARVREIMVEAGAEALLATDHATVHWLLGQETAPGVSALVTRERVVGIGGPAREDRPESALDRIPAHAPVAVETSALPTTLRPLLSGRPLLDASTRLASLRLVHDEADLRGIRAAARFASRGQQLLRGHLEPGIAEDELFAWLDSRLRADGAATTAIVDLMFGPRCASIGLPPSGRRLAPADTVIFDFAPLLGGLWADSCSTSVVGAVRPEVRRAHDCARRALDVGIAMARPGVVVGALDRAVRTVLTDAGYPECPHMIGHGIGYKQQDYPLFDPRSEAVLAAGAVVAIEPGMYLDDFGVRVEHLMLVEEHGATLLTDHDLALTPS
ncbi:M24 family metallopeptidase [Dactylosporangium sp. CA-233914]|uniref:M24 family metallopeptidase n=1 Tax=Dactylosporangium sp. CA-233914 TaxID=3239934 RepID=UPI003D8B6BC1